MAVDFQQYRRRFDEKAPEFKSGPKQNRECTDIPCLIFFIIMFFFTLGFGGYLINEGKHQIYDLVNETGDGAYSLGKVMAKHPGPIVGMLVLSNLLSVLFIVLSRAFPKCMFYSLMILSFMIYIALIIIGFVSGNAGLAVVFIIILIINVLILCCYWEYIKIGIKLIECAARFLTEKPAVYMITGLCLIINIVYTVFWIFGWIGISALNLKSSTFGHISFAWYISAIFYGFFFYYMMVFLVASAAAYWYYEGQNDQPKPNMLHKNAEGPPTNKTSILRGFMNLRYHIGSMAFASVVITIITVMRILAQTAKSKGNGVTAIIACCVACILSCIEELVKVLNHNAIIVQAITGEGYIDSAKSAIGLIFDNFGVFIIVDFFVDFMEVYATIFSVLIPAFIGGGIIYSIQSPSESAATYAVWGGIIIFLLALLLSNVILGMLQESLSSIFIFYCFDRKLRSMGVPVKNVPKQIEQIFDEAQGNEQANEASRNYMNGFNR